MGLSVVGVAVCFAIAAVGYYARGPLIVGLLASMAFGSTAVLALGGSSPLIYAYFAAMLVAAVAARRRISRNIGDVFGAIRPIWVLCSIMIYAVIGSVLFPRLFAGQTHKRIREAAGAHVHRRGFTGARLRQHHAVSVLRARRPDSDRPVRDLVLHKDRLDQVRRAFFVWICLHTGMGLIDLLGKLGGVGNVLAPIRTASYAMLTEAEQGGFARIAGAYSEASAFGGVSLSCLAFSYTYWRMTKDRLARWLAITLLALVLLSTSSTAYVGLAILGLGVFFSIGRSVLYGPA